MIERMQEDFGTDPDDLLTAIGPSIGPCCFEVGPEVAEQFAAHFPADTDAVIRPAQTEGKYMVDLWETNRRIMVDCGVMQDKITVTDLCTACHADVFHSWRKNKAPGRMAAILELI